MARKGFPGVGSTVLEGAIRANTIRSHFSLMSELEIMIHKCPDQTKNGLQKIRITFIFYASCHTIQNKVDTLQQNDLKAVDTIGNYSK